MAYYDEQLDDQTTQLDDDEQRRKLLSLRVGSSIRPILPRSPNERRTPDQPSLLSVVPPSAGDAGDLFGRPSVPLRPVQPRIPTPRTVGTEQPPYFGTPPFLGGPSNTNTSVLGAQPRPLRPNVLPTREDFPTKPEVGGWKKWLGLGLATALGSAPLAEGILHGQRDAAERRYGQAVKDWDREQADEVRQAQLENIRSEIKSRENKPAPEVKPELEAWNDLMKQNIPPREAYEILKSAGKEDKTLATDVIKRRVGGKDHNILVNKGTGEDIRDLGEVGERPPQEPGSFIPTYDSKSGALTGAWDPKSGRTVGAPQGGGTTSQGLAASDKRSQELQKQVAPLKAVVDEADKAAQLKDMADKGNAEADVDLALTFFKTMRSANSGSSGIRFTQQENNLIMGSRSLWDAMEVRGNKIFANGQPLSKTQRQQILDVINLHKQAAQRQIDGLQGGQPGAQSSGSGKAWNPRTGRYE